MRRLVCLLVGHRWLPQPINGTYVPPRFLTSNAGHTGEVWFLYDQCKRCSDVRWQDVYSLVSA